MNNLALLTTILFFLPAVLLAAEPARQRVVVLTDLCNEPDDEESMVRFLVYANEFEVEGLVTTTSVHLQSGPREDILRKMIDTYGIVRPNLVKHASNYPTKEDLLAVTRTGQSTYGMAAVGDGKSTPGSARIIEAVDKLDVRPVWVCVWGGANTLAQALWDVRKTRTQEELDRFVARLRVYAISDQDDSGRWIRDEFPKLFYIVTPCVVTDGEYWRATWTGISGDRKFQNGIMHRFEMVDNPWLEENIMSNHGPLGALYPKLVHIMEGDTPSFLGLVNNGLGWHVMPNFGGWGGRYADYQSYGESRRIWTEHRSSRDTVLSDDNGRSETSNQATIWRWREHFQNDFAARMDWCVADDYKNANHNPIAILNGDTSKEPLQIVVKSGTTVKLDCVGSRDPDNDQLNLSWWIYEEAGSLRDPLTNLFPESVTLSATSGEKTALTVPVVSKPECIHVILEVRDTGTPALWAYRRAVINIVP